MRIIGGSARGRQLNTPVGMDIRPTSDKVRQAIFNALFSRGGVVDKVVLDAFCGTGALGLEALSHGAAKSVFSDNSKVSLSLAKENAATLGFTDRAEFMLKDAAKMGARPATIPPIDIVFLDPPYRKGLVISAFDTLKAGDWLSPHAIIIIETELEAAPLEDYGTLSFDKTYGETRVTFLQID